MSAERWHKTRQSVSPCSPLQKAEEISTHESGGDAFVTCLDGVGKITIDGTNYLLHEGESIVMPAGHPHAVWTGSIQDAFGGCILIEHKIDKRR